MTLRYSSVASDELTNAVKRYEQQRPGLGGQFLAEIQNAEKLLDVHHEIGRLIRPELRSFALNRFPYKLLYAVDEDGILIVAVAHDKQRPDYWWVRVEETRFSHRGFASLEIEHAWMEEIARRGKSYAEGRENLIPAEDAIRELRERFDL